jgi:hypothetical protein
MTWSVLEASNSKETLLANLEERFRECNYEDSVEGRTVAHIRELVLDAIEDFTFPPPENVTVFTGPGKTAKATAVQVHAYVSRMVGFPQQVHAYGSRMVGLLNGSFEIKYV